MKLQIHKKSSFSPQKLIFLDLNSVPSVSFIDHQEPHTVTAVMFVCKGLITIVHGLELVLERETIVGFLHSWLIWHWWFYSSGFKILL